MDIKITRFNFSPEGHLLPCRINKRLLAFSYGEDNLRNFSRAVLRNKVITSKAIEYGFDLTKNYSTHYSQKETEIIMTCIGNIYRGYMEIAIGRYNQLINSKEHKRLAKLRKINREKRKNATLRANNIIQEKNT